MDTTKQNISMCEKAVKIQKGWKPIKGDFVVSLKYALSSYDKNILLFDRATVCTDAEPLNLRTMQYIDFVKKYCIWLPHQGQLQEMVLDYIEGTCGKNLSRLKKFTAFACEISNYMVSRSMEQLWLAFVMKEKYQKVWNGKDWEKNGS